MTSDVKLVDLDLSGNELAYISEAIHKKELSHRGAFVSRLEAELSRFLGRETIVCTSGTAALYLGLKSLGIGPGDEVLVPNLTFGTTASVVLALGATPVLVDVHPDTWGMDQNEVVHMVGHRTKAIMPVHLLGLDAGDFTKFGVPVLEDSCQAFGIVPQRGQLAAYSFFANKVISCGEGGALSGQLGNARSWRDGGFDLNYCHNIPGLNFRLTNLQAAVACAQLERVQDLLSARLHNSSRFASCLPGRGRWMFAVQATKRPDNVETRPMFPPLNLQPAFKQGGKFPVSEWIWRNHYLIPTGPHINPDKVIDAIWPLIPTQHYRQQSQAGSIAAT